MARVRPRSHKRTAAAAIAAGLCAWLMLGSGPRTPEQELLPNGSFETLGDAEMPVGWEPDFPKIPGQEPPRLAVDPTSFADGAASACISNATRDPAASAAWLAKVSEVPVDGYVELTGQVRTRGVTGAAFALLQFWEHFDYGRYRLPHHTSEVRLAELRGADWRPFRLTAHVPTGTTLITVRCCLTGSGVAWFDELSLHPADLERPPMGRDLLSNPGMEGADGLAPASWHTYGPFDDATDFRWDGDVRHSGRRSLAIAASTGSGFRWWEQWVPALPGPGAYRLSGFIRTVDLAPGSRAMLILNVYDDRGDQVALARAFDAGKPSASKEWVRVSAEVQVPDGARCARVLAFLGGPGRAWFDDLELRAEEQEGVGEWGGRRSGSLTSEQPVVLVSGLAGLAQNEGQQGRRNLVIVGDVGGPCRVRRVLGPRVTAFALTREDPEAVPAEHTTEDLRLHWGQSRHGWSRSLGGIGLPKCARPFRAAAAA